MMTKLGGKWWQLHKFLNFISSSLAGYRGPSGESVGLLTMSTMTVTMTMTLLTLEGSWPDGFRRPLCLTAFEALVGPW